MKKCCIFAFAIAALVLSSSSAHAQAMPAASRPGLLQAGITLSDANTDELTDRIVGATAFADFDFSPRLGIEADVRFLTLNTPQDFGEESYMIGLRYVYRSDNSSSMLGGRILPYGKVMAGIGKTIAEEPYVAISVPGTPGSYAAYAAGGGLDVRIPYNLSIRAIDFEYQMWPGFKPNGLSPSVISIGIAYHIK